MTSKTVSLVLGSGGARGLAHIGVIQWLEDSGYDIRSISGCSIGALIGGIYACGKLDVYEEWVRTISRHDIVDILDVSSGSQEFVKGECIIAVLRGLFGDRQIEDLPIDFTAVAADVDREKEVWLKRGSVFDAVRASISLPLFFTPFEIDGMKLVDGGILNPVPTTATFKDNTDLTIAVNLVGPPAGSPPFELDPEQIDAHWSSAVGIRAMNKSFTLDLEDRDPNDSDGVRQMLRLTNAAIDAMQGEIARQKLVAFPPDREIMIARDACKTLEFDRADEIIALGYKAAARCIEES